MHEPGVISKTNKQDCASSEMIISNNEYDRDTLLCFIFSFSQKSFSPYLCAMRHIPFSQHIHV